MALSSPMKLTSSASFSPSIRIKQFDDFEQLAPVGGVVHGYKYVGKAVDCFHVAACRYPYHFRERLRDCPGDKVYLILADFAGRKYNTLSQKFVFHVVLLIFCGAKMVPGLTKTPYAEI